MLNIKESITSIASIGLLFFPVYGEETTNAVNVSTLKSQKHETIQNMQKKEESLGAFEKLSWETDMDHAFERAQKEHKNVMIMVEDRRCKWCKNIKRITLCMIILYLSRQSKTILSSVN